jgi:hypothetical protein
MWESRRLTNLQASTAYYRDSFNFTFQIFIYRWQSVPNLFQTAENSNYKYTLRRRVYAIVDSPEFLGCSNQRNNKVSTQIQNPKII